MALISTADEHTVIRLTGGCAGMNEVEAVPMQNLFRGALEGYKGVILVGGTNMVNAANPHQTIPGITDIGPLILEDNPRSIVIGVVPRVDNEILDPDLGSIVVRRSRVTDPYTDLDCEFITVVQTHVSGVVILTDHLPFQPTIWHDEAVFCTVVVDSLVHQQENRWNSALIVYNGGKVTEDEVRMAANEHLPVILIRGSGRTADKLAEDKQFLHEHRRYVSVCSATIRGLRKALLKAGVIGQPVPVLAALSAQTQ